MAEQLYGLNERQKDRVAALVAESDRNPGGGRPPVGQYRGADAPNYLAKTRSGGIAALSGTTPGSGTVDVYYLNGSGSLVDGSLAITAYNLAATAVGASKYVMLKWAGGGYWVDFEDCT